jgi:hypothetical protein
MDTDKYTFRREYTDLYGQTKTVEHTIQGETLPEILEEFLYFLNGCSFTYLKDLIFVKENGQEVAILDYQSEIQTSADLDELVKKIESRYDPMP